MHRARMNLPNALTILRIFFVPFLVAVLVEQDMRIEWRGTVWMPNEFLALCIFLVAAATDLLDGYLARRWGQITTVGTLLDPIADKLLISAALVSLVQIRRVPAWMVVLIIGREFAADDQHHHPCRDAADLHQRNQGGRDQQFIRDGVKQRSYGRDLSPAAREIAVQKIGGGGYQENAQRQEFVGHPDGSAPFDAHVLFHQNGHQERNKEDPQDGERVREIHASAMHKDTIPVTRISLDNVASELAADRFRGLGLDLAPLVPVLAGEHFGALMQQMDGLAFAGGNAEAGVSDGVERKSGIDGGEQSFKTGSGSRGYRNRLHADGRGDLA